MTSAEFVSTTLFTFRKDFLRKLVSFVTDAFAVSELLSHQPDVCITPPDRRTPLACDRSDEDSAAFITPPRVRAGSFKFRHDARGATRACEVQSTESMKRLPTALSLIFVCFLHCPPNVAAESGHKSVPIVLSADDVIPTGNEWIALPAIRASDAALVNFNVLSMRDRGLLQVVGEQGTPALEPYFTVSGKRVSLKNLKWQLIEYWIPQATFVVDGLQGTITYCAPPGFRGAFLSLTLTNTRGLPVSVSLGVHASFGSLQRVTYTPVELKGDRSIAPAAWEKAAQVFSFVTHDTHFAWSLEAPGSEIKVTGSPVSVAPAMDAERTATLAANSSLEAHFVIGVGLEEYSASQSAAALTETIDRSGVDALVEQSAAWCKARTRTTGQPDLDRIMNRNLLFTAMFAWGKTIDTEQLVGVTSRSPRYYVSVAYWDRDAMLWSFPGLLDIDTDLAAQAVDYALTTQLRNVGTHSRFIDGVVLEDGFELDESVAPIVALHQFVQKTGDEQFLSKHRDALRYIKKQLLLHFDTHSGLYSTLQDAQDQYRKQGFSTYDNVLVWRAWKDYADLSQRLNDSAEANDAINRAESLHQAILKTCVSPNAPGATGTIFVSATDGQNPILADVPPGSLMKLPALGFISEDDPLFIRTYDWLHSKNYPYSYSDQPYGLPGSYRVAFTTSFSVADHLGLKRGRSQALKILQYAKWDGGIISEGIDPATGLMDQAGGAFATAAGYVGHMICQFNCQ